MATKGKSGGVLPVTAAATKKDKSSQGQAKSSPRTQGPRLRLIIRRLPPGLTETEFWSALGEEWRVGKSKVDWAAFKEGKVSKDPAKPSRPARGYLKVKDQSLLDELSAKIKQTPFQDAKNTTRDPCLIGPPSLEFAPYNKLASGRVRNDGRQGTIDQDQEFIDFLQSLTEPITKGPANGTEADAQEKVTTTPLVQYLKEKKANKAKEAAEKKNSKARQQETKEGKQPKAEKSTVVVKGSNTPADKAKLAKATQETVKAVNKSVAALQAKTTTPSAKTEEKPATKSAPAQTPAPAKRERERGSAAAAARMVQRDLGLTPKASRAARAASAAATSTAANTTATPSKPETATTEKPVASAPATKTPAPATPTAAPPTGPRATRNDANTTAANTPPAAPAVSAAKAAPAPRPKAIPQPSPGAKSAFLKHANPSQGVTEDLLRAAFSTFGSVTRCEIDKKKGLGYIDFEDADGLRKAMAASPVKVGEKGGQVVVLENRNMAKGAKAAAGKGSNGPTVVGAAGAVKAGATPIVSPKATPAKPAADSKPKPTAQAQSAAPTAPATADPPSTSTATAPSSEPAVATPPTAPRGNVAGRGGTNARGGRGGQRGGFRGRGRGRGAATTASPGQSPANTTATAPAPPTGPTNESK